MVLNITVPTGSIDWNKFYGSFNTFSRDYGEPDMNVINKAWFSDDVGSKPAFSAIADLFGGSEESGTDPVMGTTGEGVGVGVGSGFWGNFDFGSALARIAIVILGMIFVAVGLSMFSAANSKESTSSKGGTQK